MSYKPYTYIPCLYNLVKGFVEAVSRQFRELRTKARTHAPHGAAEERRHGAAEAAEDAQTRSPGAAKRRETWRRSGQQARGRAPPGAAQGRPILTEQRQRKNEGRLHLIQPATLRGVEKRTGSTRTVTGVQWVERAGTWTSTWRVSARKPSRSVFRTASLALHEAVTSPSRSPGRAASAAAFSAAVKNERTNDSSRGSTCSTSAPTAPSLERADRAEALQPAVADREAEGQPFGSPGHRARRPRPPGPRCGRAQDACASCSAR